MHFKNMKIAVTADQPLDEIVMELKRLGYEPLNKFAIRKDYSMWLVAYCDGTIVGWRDASILGDTYSKTTTLAELKEM